jgi:hypothetical protein
MVLLTLMFATFLSTSHLPRILTPEHTTTKNATMAPQEYFAGFPGELRNKFYEEHIATLDHRPVIKVEWLNKTDCQTVPQLLQALGFESFFPLLFTDKRTMNEALPYCLDICTLPIQNLDQMSVIKGLQHLPAFRKVMSNIRNLTIDLALFWRCNYERQPGHTARCWPESNLLERFPREWYATANMRRVPRDMTRPTQEFTTLFRELQAAFPKVKEICVEVDGTTLRLQTALKASVAELKWPSLRNITVRRPDLEYHLAMAKKKVCPLGPANTVRIEWSVEMDDMFLENVNSGLAKILESTPELESKLLTDKLAKLALDEGDQ